MGRVRRSRLPAMLWVAFVAVVAAVGLVLLRACGLLVPALGWNFCPSLPLALSAEAEHGANLSKQVRKLELELARKSLACASIQSPSLPSLELPTHPGASRPQQTAQLKPPPSPVLKMPEKPTENYSFLKGCWRTDPFRHSPRRPAPGVSTYCFDDKGNGQLEFHRPSEPGYSCRAPAQARFSGQEMIIRDSDTTCTNGGRWWADNLVCRRSEGGIAQCSGTSHDDIGPTSWTVLLNRVQ